MPKDKLPADPKDLYIRTPRMSVRQLAEKYKGRRGCSVRTLADRCTAENWQELRNNHRNRTLEKTEEKIAEKQSEVTLSTLQRINAKHTKRVNRLFELNEMLISQHIEQLPDKSQVFNMTLQDFRRVVQNEKDLMEFERLINNLPMTKPGEEISEEAAQKMLEMLEKSAKNDWANYKQKQADGD